MRLDIIGWADGLGAAELMGAERRAAVAEISSPADLDRILPVAPNPVLFSLGSKLSTRELAHIVQLAHRSGVPCGFIDGWRGPQSAEEHAAGLARWSSAGSPGVTTWFEGGQINEIPGRFEDVEVVVPGPGTLGRLLSATTRVLCLANHGNGIDAELTGAVLCGLIDRPAERPLTRYLPCADGGMCVRASLTADGSYQTPRLISAKTLPGDVVVWGSCSGVLASDSRFDPAGGLLRTLLAPGWLRQVIVTFKPTPIDESALLAASMLADSGVPLGEIVAILNNAYAADPFTNGTMPWLLVGDPTARLRPADATPMTDSPDLSQRQAGVMRSPTAGRDRIVTVDSSDVIGDPPRLWVAPVPGNPLVAWLRDAAADGASLRASIRSATSDAAYQTISRVWNSADRLRFTNEFFRAAHASAAGNGFVHPDPVADETERTVLRLQSMRTALDGGATFSGWAADLEALATAEDAGWLALNRVLQSEFVDYLRSFDRVMGHGYRGAAPDSIEGGIQCRYCGSDTLVQRHRFASGYARDVVLCDRCAVVSDADADIGAVWMQGPEMVTPGLSVEYRLTFEEWPPTGFQALVAAAVLRHKPLTAGKELPEIAVRAVHAQDDLVLAWRPPDQIPHGFYHLCAAVVADGSIMLAQRPLYV